jgi:hypothetical protein
MKFHEFAVAGNFLPEPEFFFPEPEFFWPEPEVKNPEFAQHYLVLAYNGSIFWDVIPLSWNPSTYL